MSVNELFRVKQSKEVVCVCVCVCVFSIFISHI